MNEAIRHEPRQPQTSRRKADRMALPCSVCDTSGWNWMPYRWRVSSAMAAHDALAVRATQSKPGGGSRMLSPWLIQTRCRDGVAARIGVGRVTSRSAGPNSRSGTRSTRPRSTCAMACIP